MTQAPSNTVIVLVVEDEPLQRMDMVELAESAGFEVLEAFNADQAIALLEKRLDVRVVLADIDMPGTMDGLRLGAAIRRRWPPIEIILTTAGIAPRADELPERAIFLPKPLNHERVISTMRQFLA